MPIDCNSNDDDDDDDNDTMKCSASVSVYLIGVDSTLQVLVGWLVVNNVLTIMLGKLGSGCGSVGRAVTSDARGLRSESSHHRIFN